MEDSNKTFEKTIDFIFSIIYKAFLSSPLRICIFILVILFHNGAYLWLSFQEYPVSYYETKEIISSQLALRFLFRLIEYSLLIILIYKSPKESTSKRTFGKFFISFFLLWFFFSFILVSDNHYDNSKEAELVRKSFPVNKISILGKVVFSSYASVNNSFSKSAFYFAEVNSSSEKKDCFVVIVKIDTSAYQYPLLKNYTYSFNELTEERRCPTNIPSLINDISNCIKFEIVLNDYYVPFSNEQQVSNSKKRFPKLPEVNRYVKIQYDPIENGIALVTNPNGVNLIPSFHDADEQPRLKGILKWMDSDSIEIPTF
jgi:hypothetical protein